MGDGSTNHTTAGEVNHQFDQNNNQSPNDSPVNIMDPNYYNKQPTDIQTTDNSFNMLHLPGSRPRVISQDSVYDTVKSRVSVMSRVSRGRVVVNIGRKPKPPPPPPESKNPCANFPPDGGRLISGIYVIIVACLGVIFPVSEALRGQWSTEIPSGLFSAYLYIMSIVYLLLLEFYLTRKARKHGPRRRNRQQDIVYADTIGNANVMSTVSGKAAFDNMASVRKAEDIFQQGPYDPEEGSVTQEPLELLVIEAGNYDDDPMPHQTSLYLRIGGALFGLGTMIYDALLLKQSLNNTGEIPLGCPKIQVWPIYIHLVFMLVQTYFIFKHPQLHITRWKSLSRIGFMHMFATNWCVWVRTLVHETFESFLHHTGSSSYGSHSPSHGYDSHNLTQHTTAETWTLDPNVTYISTPYPHLGNITTHHPSTDHALQCPLFVDELLMKASPYLFPCVLEYSLLAAATMYSMYADLDYMNSDKDAEKKDSENNAINAAASAAINSTINQRTVNGTVGNGMTSEIGNGNVPGRETNQSKSGKADVEHPTHVHLTEVNFHKTHRGLFLGLLVFACAAVSILLFFSYKDDDGNMHLLVYYASDNALQGLLLVVVLIGWMQIQRLQFTPPTHGLTVDQTLLLLAMTGVLMFHLFKLFAMFHTIKSSADADNVVVLNFTASLIALILCLTQTCFIIDGMARSSCTRKNLEYKPGRGSVTFLLFANIATWLFKTFQMKEVQIETNSEKEVYGYLATQLIVHAFSPLLIFYYYHSSACIAHIWSHAYTKETVQAAEEAEKSQRTPPLEGTSPVMSTYSSDEEVDIWSAFRLPKNRNEDTVNSKPASPTNSLPGSPRATVRKKKRPPLSPLAMEASRNSLNNSNKTPDTPKITITDPDNIETPVRDKEFFPNDDQSKDNTEIKENVSQTEKESTDKISSQNNTDGVVSDNDDKTSPDILSKHSTNTTDTASVTSSTPVVTEVKTVTLPGHEPETIKVVELRRKPAKQEQPEDAVKVLDNEHEASGSSCV